MNQPAEDATRPPDGTTPRGIDGDSVDTALQLAIDLHGPSLLSRPDKLRRHLEAQCPNASFDIDSLLAALEERVPQALLATTSSMQMQALVPQLQEMLAERRRLNPFAATWAVTTWAAALRMDLFEPDRPRVGRGVEGTKVSATTGIPDFAPTSSGLPSPPGPAPVVGAKTTTAPATFTVPFGLQSVPKPVPVAVTASPVVIPFTPRVPEQALIVAPLPEPIVEPPEPLAEAIVPVIDEPPVDQLAVPELEAVAAVAPAVIAAPLPPPEPPWVSAAEPPARRFNPWLGLLGVVTAAAVAIAAMRFVMPTDVAPAPPASTSPMVEAPSKPAASTPAPAETPSVAVAAPTAPAPTAPAPDEVALVAVAPPAIVSIVSPATIAPNTPFMLTIEFTPGGSPVTSVERKSIAADGGVEATARTTSISSLASPREGTLRYPVEGLAASARGTLEFTLVDRDGSRSEPKRVIVEAAAPTKAATETSTPPAKAESVVCTRSTCGSVVSVREIDRAKNNEVIVRMDDRSIQALVSSTPWKVGARVRRAGARIVAVDAVQARRAAPPASAAPRALPESPPIVDR